MTTFAAIPTTYSGVQFRSRLEARWAAFYTAGLYCGHRTTFDLCAACSRPCLDHSDTGHSLCCQAPTSGSQVDVAPAIKVCWLEAGNVVQWKSPRTKKRARR